MVTFGCSFELPFEFVEELLCMGAYLRAGATANDSLDFLPVLSKHLES